MAEDTKASSEKRFPMLLLQTASTKHVKESLTVVLKYEIVWEIRASWHQFRKRSFSTAFESTEIAIIGQSYKGIRQPTLILLSNDGKDLPLPMETLPVASCLQARRSMIAELQSKDSCCWQGKLIDKIASADCRITS